MQEKNHWWRSSVGYVIYPLSFQDSNGDGYGDLKGIESRLGYLKDLGVNLLWVCPIFDSPMVDSGYDVSDYFRINPLLGSMDDLKSLLSACHNNGIKLCLDFPLNHTSEKHAWFKEAINNPSSDKRNYYYIRKGKKTEKGLLPPNNWKSFFGGSAWERIGDSDDFYLHLFSKSMPDLNWANPSLRQEIYKVAKFYLDLGIDGFRLDAVAHLGKDPSFADAPNNLDENGLSSDTAPYSHRPELFAYLKEMKEEVFSKYPCLTIGEVGGELTPDIALKYASYENGSIDLVFNFDTAWSNGAYGSIGKEDKEIRTDVIGMKKAFERWYQCCSNKCDLPLYWNDHDHPRALSQYGSKQYRNESAKMLLTLSLFMYGTPFIYNGEEIGMANPLFSNIEDFRPDEADVIEMQDYKKQGFSDEQILAYMNRCSRLNSRTPIPWDGSANAGFTSGTPFRKIGEEAFHGINVLQEMEDPWSILNFAQYAIEKKNKPSIAKLVNAPWKILDMNHPDVFAYIHEAPEGKLVCIANMRPFFSMFGFYYSIDDVILHNYGDVLYSDHVFTLRPYEVFLLRV